MVPCHAALDWLSLSAALGSSDFLKRQETRQCTLETSAAQKQREGALLGKFGCFGCKVLVGMKKAVQKMG